MEQVRSSKPESLYVWWLGQSGFLVCWDELVILFDPYLSDSLTRKYAETDKPHIRMTEQVVEPGRLDFVDLVTSSHNHTDHLDGDTLIPLLQSNPRMNLVLPEVNQDFAENRLGGFREKMIGLKIGEVMEVGPMSIRGVPAAHEKLSPEFMGFHVTLGPWSLYHSGDTLWVPEIDEALSGLRTDLAFLPINGRAPERRVAGNLNGEEAASLAKQCGMGCVIPCHYDMFTFNTASPDFFVEQCQQKNQPFKVLQAGERFSLPLR